MNLVLHNSKLILPHGIERGGVIVEDGGLARVFADDNRPAGLGGPESIDLKGAYLAPGLIDIHIHGSAGVDVQATDEAGLAKLSEFLLCEGVTGYFPTFVPASDREYTDALASVVAYTRQQDDSAATPRARILGVHFEGPFVNRNRCGALKREHFRTYDGDTRSIELFTGGKGSSNLTRLTTLAPEVAGGIELIRELTHSGVRVFIGHSQADLDTLDQAAEAGSRHITHFPNALDPLHHRKPGAIAWGLTRDDVTVDCIADLHHVHPLMLRLMHQSKGADRMALISDAIKPAGLGDGEFSVWDETITVTDGRTALAREPNTIAGSVITMRDALKNIINLGIPIDDAVRMASGVPARVAGIDSAYGSIEGGKRADLIAFDNDHKITLAVVGGRCQTF
ncbi:MAG TPA: N-acetylglucosamine-6-phosphate deacetylase [Blastocatellia bacterium]|nr:N-acetylglucosamine-6-phosphate deacetylase [Blastocatellia bacterium]